MTYNIIRILYKKATSQNRAEKKGKKKNPPPSFSISYLLHIKDVQLQYDDGKERPVRRTQRPRFWVYIFLLEIVLIRLKMKI